MFAFPDQNTIKKVIKGKHLQITVFGVQCWYCKSSVTGTSQETFIWVPKIQTEFVSVNNLKLVKNYDRKSETVNYEEIWNGGCVRGFAAYPRCTKYCTGDEYRCKYLIHLGDFETSGSKILFKQCYVVIANGVRAQLCRVWAWASSTGSRRPERPASCHRASSTGTTRKK